MAKTKTLADVQSELEAKIKAGNKIIATKADLTHSFLASFSELEKEYATLMANKVYAELKQNPLPMVAACKLFSYPVLKKVEVKENGEITTLVLEQKERQIDLLKFCEHGTEKQKLDTMWRHEATGMCQFMSMVTAADIGYSDLELAVVNKSYYMQKEARALLAMNMSTANDKIKVSKKSLVQRLQRVVDAILPPTDETKVNQYKVINCHVNFVTKSFTKLSRKPGVISVAKDGFFRGVLLHILHCLTTGKRMGIDGYRLAKDAQYYIPPTVIPAEPQKEVEPAYSFSEEDDLCEFEEDLGDIEE